MTALTANSSSFFFNHIRNSVLKYRVKNSEGFLILQSLPKQTKELVNFKNPRFPKQPAQGNQHSCPGILENLVSRLL